MEKLRRVVTEIAYSHNFSKLPLLHQSLLPLLNLASSCYNLSLTTRNHLYLLGFFPKQRLPIPVISVGNLTWGGNGKTPMVEFLSIWFSNSGISPLILSRGYAGGDEAKMLQRHLMGTSVKVGIGANRAKTASWFLKRYGYRDSCADVIGEKLLLGNKVSADVTTEKIDAAILDDGMQHVSLERDLDIVMVNGLMPWGNGKLIPLGPLREPLSALARADIVVIHHADLVHGQILIKLKLEIQKMKESFPVFFSKMVPSHLFTMYDVDAKVPLSTLEGRVVLCLSAIGSPNSFVKCVEKVGPMHIDQLHYSDHYLFQSKDIDMMRMRLEELKHNFGSSPIVVTTEKDYDRDRVILSQLCPFEILVLCSQLQFVSTDGKNADKVFFKEIFKQILDSRSRRAKIGECS